MKPELARLALYLSETLKRDQEPAQNWLTENHADLVVLLQSWAETERDTKARVRAWHALEQYLVNNLEVA